jgi:DNA-binding Xre family transcriptional regulator
MSSAAIAERRKMGWRYLLEDRLKDLNQGRSRLGKKPLRWADVSFVIGVSRQALQNLASNREMKVTNTRHLDALCRFFNCKLDAIMEPVPVNDGPPPDDELDRLIAIKERLKQEGVPEKDFVLDVGDRPSCHIEVLYDREAHEHWKTSQQPEG